MSKKIKMVLYGEPGVGKSVFAFKAPKPFFICTDGNYEWLSDFGAKEEDHVQVYSWEEAKSVFKLDFEGYDTIVVDLVEDLFKWNEQEFCKRNRLDHVSDAGYGKGYDITRNEFFLEISKLLAKDKHIILISHGITSVLKDRRGVEHTIYNPSSRVPDKVWDMIEGRVRYFLRCYLQAEEVEDETGTKLMKKRYLSLVPKENEFGIIRGVDENTIPHDIPLDFDEFAKEIGLELSESSITPKKVISSIEKTHKEFSKEKVINDILGDIKEDVEEEADKVIEETKKRRRRSKTSSEETKTESEPVTIEEAIDEAKENDDEAPLEVTTENKESEKIKAPTAAISRADKLAAIKAKLAAKNK